MDQFVLLQYLQKRDKKLGDLSVNSQLAGNNKGLEEQKQERAILAALANLVRASDLPRFQPGTVGKPKKIEMTEEQIKALYDEPAVVLAFQGVNAGGFGDGGGVAEVGPEFDPEPDLAALRAADESKRVAEALAQSDPSLAPAPPAPFMAARNVGGRPRKDGSPAQPRTP
jgi:hypothetical protein